VHIQEQLDADYHKRIEEHRKLADEATEKKRAKRQKKKEKQKAKKKLKNSDNQSSDRSNDQIDSNSCNSRDDEASKESQP